MPRTFKPGPVKLKRIKRPQLDVTWNQPSTSGNHDRSQQASHVSPEHETWNECVTLVSNKSKNVNSKSKSSSSSTKGSSNFSVKRRKSSKKDPAEKKMCDEKVEDEKASGNFNFSLCVMEMLDPLLDQHAEREEHEGI